MLRFGRFKMFSVHTPVAGIDMSLTGIVPPLVSDDGCPSAHECADPPTAVSMRPDCRRALLGALTAPTQTSTFSSPLIPSASLPQEARSLVGDGATSQLSPRCSSKAVPPDRTRGQELLTRLSIDPGLDLPLGVDEFASAMWGLPCLIFPLVMPWRSHSLIHSFILSLG